MADGSNRYPGSVATEPENQATAIVPALDDPAGTLLYRAMDIGADGRPRVHPDHLGVRVNIDIEPDGQSRVRPGTGGMSVTPNDPSDLPRPHRPPELGGTGKRPVWHIAEPQLPSDLVYRPDPRKRTHGFVEPRDLMEFSKYEAAVISTGPAWSLFNV